MLNAVAAALADAFLSGDWTTAGLRQRGRVVVGRRKWLNPLVAVILAAHPEAPHAHRSGLVHRILVQHGFAKAMSRSNRPKLTFRFLDPYRMGDRRWDVPAIPTTGDLADWLQLSLPDLEWLADRRNLLRDRREGPLHHYVCRWVPKRSGGARLIEAPKPRLRAIQRRILREILDRVPPHDAAHGFRPGRSVVGHASLHAGRAMVVRMDLRDFFPTTRARRIRGLFQALGYPDAVASTLTGLCTTRTPPFVRDLAPTWVAGSPYGSAHLPQGAPTSPALANLAAWPLDLRLTAAAAASGATYSRYADDLAFSGGPDFATRARWFAEQVWVIALDEGYGVNRAKTRILPASVRQELVGIVVNDRPSLRRADLERLEAILHNCVRHGPVDQNREGVPDWRGHLEGRVGWVRQVAPHRAEPLESLLARIPW